MGSPSLAYEVTELTGIRKLIAARMSASHTQIPGVHVVEECDVSELRMAHLVGTVALAIARLTVRYPIFNAHVVNDEIRTFGGCRLGVAVDTDRGLVVPVVEVDLAGGLSPAEITDRIAEIAARARSGRLTGRDIDGATITLTSPGKSGGVLATPLINPPQTAIIGVHRAVDRAVVIDGRIVARRILNLTVTFDHRVIDGATAGRYARDLRAEIERTGAG